jgi:hypothetical protein
LQAFAAPTVSETSPVEVPARPPQRSPIRLIEPASRTGADARGNPDKRIGFRVFPTCTISIRYIDYHVYAANTS